MSERPLAELRARVTDNGVSFDCPACVPPRWPAGADPHRITVQWAEPRTNRVLWDRVSGTTAADLTLSPSIDCTSPCGGGCKFHGWIRNGLVSW